MINRGVLRGRATVRGDGESVAKGQWKGSERQ